MKNQFDILSLLDFRPPKYLCPCCAAIASAIAEVERADAEKNMYLRCATCDNSNSIRVWALPESPDILEHSKNLARVAASINDPVYDAEGRELYKNMSTKVILDALSKAQHFVHFSTYGLDQIWFGALKMLSIRVPVRGIVSNLNPGDRIRKEIEEYSFEAPHLQINIFGSEPDAPHVKFIIIDGLLLLKGSFNLTWSGLRTKGEQNRDSFEIITDVDQIRSYNNKYFSSVWRDPVYEMPF